MNFPFQLLPSALIVLFTLKAQSGRQTRHGLEILTGAVQKKRPQTEGRVTIGLPGCQPALKNRDGVAESVTSVLVDGDGEALAQSDGR
jgi:hypothetical protein